jgi:hypothetical protein
LLAVPGRAHWSVLGFVENGVLLVLTLNNLRLKVFVIYGTYLGQITRHCGFEPQSSASGSRLKAGMTVISGLTKRHWRLLYLLLWATILPYLTLSSKPRFSRGFPKG